VITIETDIMHNVGGYESWWEVAVSEVAGIDSVNKAYREYKKKKEKQRYYL
jgi:3D-(3,5/4)-trihydroxycyclohexane-1,2-dione acylhydrolase (decyclizing)